MSNDRGRFFMWTILAPVSVQVSKNKKFILNLNQYRNAHHHTLDKAKKEFAEIVKPRLVDLPVFDKIRISYYLFAGTAQKCDVANVCSIVDKFFSDCLTATGRIPDDNYDHLTMVAYGWGGVDRGNARVEAIIERLA